MPHKKSEDGWLSVTEVLSLAINKPWLCLWYGKNGTARCEQIKRESQKIGSEVHELIENRFNGIDDDYTNRMIVNFWEKFVIPFEVKPVFLEQTVKNSKLKLQGTFDAVINTNRGVNVTADWKTSNQLDKVTVPLQLCA